MRHLVLALVIASAPVLSLSADGPRAQEKKAVPREAAQLPQGAEAPQPVTQIEAVGPVSSLVQSPVTIGVDSDVNCSGWIGAERESFAGSIISAEGLESKASFTQGDVIFISLGKKQGVVAGQEFWIIRPDKMVSKPLTGDRETLGRLYLTPGRLKVICPLEDDSIAEVVNSCSDAAIGDLLRPYEPIPLPLVRRTPGLTSCDPATGKVTGHIAHIIDSGTQAGQDYVVYLDLGEDAGLGPGDFLTVYRPRTRVGGTRTILGELAILKTTPKTSVAKIISSADFMEIGDFVELK